MTCLAFVNLTALAMLIKVGLRVMKDYDEQRKAGIDQPVFDGSKFADLDLDRASWPAAKPAADAQPQSAPELLSTQR